MLEISSKNIKLRPFVEADAIEFVAAVIESVKTVGLWMPWCHSEYTKEEANTWFDRCQKNIDEDIAYDIGIFSAIDDKLIGGISINQIDHTNKIGNIGYWVRESLQKQGYATGAVKLIESFGFNTLGLTRLELVILEKNMASRNVAEKLGATYECIAQNRLMHNERAMAAVVYSILPS